MSSHDQTPYAPPSPVRSLGTVRVFNDDRGFGFVKPDDGGPDVFVHFTAIRTATKQRRTLYTGQRVSFDIETAERGPRAVRVEVVG